MGSKFTLYGKELKIQYCVWLIYAHILGMIGLFQFFQQDWPVIHKTLTWVVFFHSIYGLGITAGCHRLWAHKTYEANAPLRFMLAMFNAGTNLFLINRGLSRICLPLES